MTNDAVNVGDGVVAVCRVADSVAQAVERAMVLAEWWLYVPRGSRVALKPNLCWDLPLPGVQTSPWVFDAVISVLKQRAADIVVVEADQLTVDADAALERSGIGRIVSKHGLQFVNMSRGKFVASHLDGAFVLHDAMLPEVLADRVLVTVPVLKCHGMTTISGALKNQWGCLPEDRHRYHPVIHEAIADLNGLLRPAFAVLDATVSLEGSGPKTGTPRVTDVVMASADLVAIDSAAAALLGSDPAGIAHIGHAHRRGLGTSTGISVVGDAVAPVSGFRAPRPNLIARAERVVRGSGLGSRVLTTRVVALPAFAARVWNAVWWVGVGYLRRKRILERSRYGAQWRGLDECDGGSAEGGRR